LFFFFFFLILVLLLVVVPAVSPEKNVRPVPLQLLLVALAELRQQFGREAPSNRLADAAVASSP
jgi:hypothetical protein